MDQRDLIQPKQIEIEFCLFLYDSHGRGLDIEDCVRRSESFLTLPVEKGNVTPNF
jgi:hypothetical protein